VAAQRRNDDALALLDGVDAIARADEAHRILQQVSSDESRRTEPAGTVLGGSLTAVVGQA
jgi:hypothetical protein